MNRKENHFLSLRENLTDLPDVVNINDPCFDVEKTISWHVVLSRWILTKNYKELMKGSKCSISSFINLVMELKKCCNHGFLVRSPDSSETLNKSQFEVVIAV